MIVQKRCCEEGLDASIVEDARGRCSLHRITAPCPAYAAGVCAWKRGMDACVGWDPRVHPLTAAPRCQVDARRADLGQASQAAAAAPAATTPTTAGTGGALNSDDDGDDDDEDSDNDSGGDSDGVDEPGYDDDFDADGDNIRLEAPCDLDDDEQANYDLEQEIIEHFDDDS
jgi:hypothetical protein